MKWVRCLEGSELWSVVDDGWVDREALQAALEVVPRTIPNIRDDPGFVLFPFEYVDGVLIPTPELKITYAPVDYPYAPTETLD